MPADDPKKAKTVCIVRYLMRVYHLTADEVYALTPVQMSLMIGATRNLPD